MSDSNILWQSPAMPQETPRDAATRFVRESWGVERDIVWTKEPGVFRFADGVYCYRIEYEGRQWQVRRLDILAE